LDLAARSKASGAAMPAAAVPGGVGELFRTKRIPEIRAAEGATRREISAKEEELRQLVGRSYRDLLDSADSILLIKQSSDAISDNLARISGSLSSLSPPAEPSPALSAASPSPSAGGRARLYALAARAKYLVDTPEHIWGRLDEGLLLEAAGRYLRAQVVHGRLSRDAAAADALCPSTTYARHQQSPEPGTTRAAASRRALLSLCSALSSPLSLSKSALPSHWSRAQLAAEGPPRRSPHRRNRCRRPCHRRFA